jgi:regulator of cell morphogenesis and NO signaling
MTYTPNHPMARLIADNYPLLQVMSRFGIKVGFGDKTVREVCESCDVHTPTFLAVVNYVVEGYSEVELEGLLHFPLEESRKVAISILHYLRQSHIYFLEFFLPSIRNKLLRGIHLSTNDVSFLILRFFDDYVTEVKTHMQIEEQTVFEYVKNLTEGHKREGFTVNTYSDHHHEVSSKLKELKSLILKYCPDNADVNLLNAALYDIYRCEQELESHCSIEDNLFVPLVTRLENEED